jgi:galactokinase
MEKSDQMKACLEKAADCERRALLVTDEAHRKTYVELALLWRDMAEQGEMLKRLHQSA